MTSRDILNSTIKSSVTLLKSYFHTLPFSSCQNHDMPYLILCFQFSRMLRNNRQILNLCRQKCQVSAADNGVATLALAAPPVNTLNAELLSSIKTNIDQGISAKVGCPFPVVLVSILPHAEFGPDDHREDAPHFTKFLAC